MSEKSITVDVGLTEARAIDSFVTRGDWSQLQPQDRARAYVQVCAQHGLNALSQPFAFLRLNGKEVLYATRGATDQLAAKHSITREIIDGPKIVDIAGTKVALCTARATLPTGRSETGTATLPVADPVNLYMKLETKAKRRATIALLGLAMLDETELATIPDRSQADAPQPSREDLERAVVEVQQPRALPPLASLGVEVQAPATTPAPVEARDLVAEVRDSAAVRHTVRELADLWRGVREELKAAKLERGAWDVVVARCKALELIPKAVTAEIARLDAQDRGPGPKGGTPRPEAPAHTDATGTGQDVAPAAAAVALVPTWCSDVDAMERHIEGYSHAVAVERCARKHRAALPRAARERTTARSRWSRRGNWCRAGSPRGPSSACAPRRGRRSPRGGPWADRPAPRTRGASRWLLDAGRPTRSPAVTAAPHPARRRTRRRWKRSRP
jgi:hypothetical protein